MQKNGKKQPLHTQIIPSGTYTKEEFIERVSCFQYFPVNVVGGVTGDLVDELASLLASYQQLRKLAQCTAK